MTEEEVRFLVAQDDVRFLEFERDQIKNLINKGGIFVSNDHRLDLEKTLAKLHVARDVVAELQRALEL